jgi:FixJ family two-component response regulator
MTLKTIANRLGFLQKQIVIVDDDLNCLEVTKDIVCELCSGFKIVCFSSPECAKKYIEINHKQIVMLITDEKMPKLTGGKLCSYARRLNPSIQRILVTAYNSDSDYSDVSLYEKYIKTDVVTKIVNKPFKETYFQSIISLYLGLDYSQNPAMEIRLKGVFQ